MYFQHTGNSLGYSYNVVNSVCNKYNVNFIYGAVWYVYVGTLFCNCTRTFMLKVMFTVASGIVIVKFYCIITRLEICSTRLYTGNLF